MPIDSLLTTIFFLETKSLPSIPTKRYESEPDLPKPKLLLPNAGRQPPLPFYREDVPPAKKGQVNNVLPSRRLIAPSLLTTENIARSKYSSRKKLLLHEKLPKPPKGASKLASFPAILAVRRHAVVRPEGLLAPSSARFSIDKRSRLCMHGARKGLGSLLSYPLLVATTCFNPAENSKALRRPADQLSAKLQSVQSWHMYWGWIYAYMTGHRWSTSL